jgi:asparagine synthetase A
MTIDFPLNGHDLVLFFEGRPIDETETEVFKVVANFKRTEVFRFDGEKETGLLAYTDMSEDIMNAVKTLLQEEYERL